MNTTRAMLVIGILMLVLAVIVAQGLRPDEETPVSGPVVSGTVSKAPETPQIDADEPGTPNTVVPLDTGTLRMDSTSPVNGLSAVSPTETPEAAVAPPEQKASSPTSGPRTQVVTTSAPKNPAPGKKAVTRTRLEIGSRSATFRLTGAEELKGKAFVLKEPDRIVVDLDGAWDIALAKTPDNTLIKSVRAGSQESNTRLVFDLHRAPRSFKLVQVAPKTLELQIR